MLGNSETRCAQAVFDFIKTDPMFRPVTVERERRIPDDPDIKSAFMLVGGSYSAKDAMLGIIFNYDITAFPGTGTGFEIVYRVSCSPVFSLTITRETRGDLAIKKIGPETEIEIGDPALDDIYFIKTSNARSAKDFLKQERVRGFLISNIKDLEKFEIKDEYIKFRRSFDPENNKSETITSDMKELFNISEIFTAKVF